MTHLRLIMTHHGMPGWAQARPLVDARSWTLNGVWRLWIYRGDGSSLARNIDRPALAAWLRQLRRNGWRVTVCRHFADPNDVSCGCHLVPPHGKSSSLDSAAQAACVAGRRTLMPRPTRSTSLPFPPAP